MPTLPMTHVKPIATATNCSATEKPSLYAVEDPLDDSVAKLKIPPLDKPDGNWMRIPGTVTGKDEPCETFVSDCPNYPTAMTKRLTLENRP